MKKVLAVDENMKETLTSVGLEVEKIRKKHANIANEVIKKFMPEISKE